MIGIVYSSKTGNTEFLANTLNLMESKFCMNINEIEQLEEVDILCVGFWCDKGDCDMQMQNFLANLHNKKVFLFGTAGFGKSQDYFHQILQNVKSHLDASNTVVGTWMCQGKMPLSLRSKFLPNPEMLRNFDVALKHPNDKDANALLKKVNEIMYAE